MRIRLSAGPWFAYSLEIQNPIPLLPNRFSVNTAQMVESKNEATLNTKQRIVLILGTVAFLYAILSSPKVSIINGTYFIPPQNRRDMAKTIDVRTAITRAIAVLGATVLVSFALKDREKPRIQSILGRSPLADDSQESERKPVRKELLAKILSFLREFF